MKKKRKLEFTSETHYVECDKCGPKINIRVDWKYVRSVGICKGCRSRNILGTLKEVWAKEK